MNAKFLLDIKNSWNVKNENNCKPLSCYAFKFNAPNISLILTVAFSFGLLWKMGWLAIAMEEEMVLDIFHWNF